ncbi:DUF4293 domain-containing protein [Aridibaculum aurantiacum]|uniref:DUF4293 domain-containing protein n=1 Tax=Aridibaculum aurantiacum TaxID=2810307 RepID=UPI001A97B136|nr:DUF4293 domain-containing protein [Aridibaculum aurantiacum]
MIQRIQSIWLLLAAIVAFVYTQVPLFTGTLPDGLERNYLATENLLLFALAVAVGLIAATAIFLYKNRPMQMRLCFFGLLGSIALIALEVLRLDNFKTDYQVATGTYAWGSLLPIFLIVFFILAWRGVRKDQKLIKSMDRLR